MRIFFICLVIMLAIGNVFAQDDLKGSLEAGSLHMQEGDYPKAIEDFQRAAAIDPHMAGIQNALGVAYLNLPDGVDKAQVCFEKAIELKPDFAEAYFNLGITYAQYRQDQLSAKEYFEKTIQYDPHFATAYHALGLVYLMEKNDAAQAQPFFEKAVELDPNLAQAYFSLGLSYAMQGKTSEVLGPISRLRALRNEQFAVSLESLVRGDGVFLTKLRPRDQETDAPAAAEMDNVSDLSQNAPK